MLTVVFPTIVSKYHIRISVNSVISYICLKIKISIYVAAKHVVLFTKTLMGLEKPFFKLVDFTGSFHTKHFTLQ